MAVFIPELSSQSFGEGGDCELGGAIERNSEDAVAANAVYVDKVSVVNAAFFHQLVRFPRANAQTKHVHVEHVSPVLCKKETGNEVYSNIFLKVNLNLV